MDNYFFLLPIELQKYIIYLNESHEAVELIKKNYRKYRIKKKELIFLLINDLGKRNNCWLLKNSIINVFDNNMTLFSQDINCISPSDPYTTIILRLINRLIVGNEFFGNNPLISLYLWNRFLWALTIGLCKDNFSSNSGYKYFEFNMELYYDLRLKTGHYALQYDIKLLNLLPSLFIIEKFDSRDFED